MAALLASGVKGRCPLNIAFSHLTQSQARPAIRLTALAGLRGREAVPADRTSETRQVLEGHPLW
jgi:hypothetical protein